MENLQEILRPEKEVRFREAIQALYTALPAAVVDWHYGDNNDESDEEELSDLWQEIRYEPETASPWDFKNRNVIVVSIDDGCYEIIDITKDGFRVSTLCTVTVIEDA